MLFFPQEVQCFYKIQTCQSNFTVRDFSGVLHGLLPIFLLSLVYRVPMSEKLMNATSETLRIFIC